MFYSDSLNCHKSSDIMRQLILLSIIALMGFSDQDILVEGEGTVMINDPSKTRQYYEITACQSAKMNALDKAFGTSVLSNYEQIMHTLLQGRNVEDHFIWRNNYLNSYPNGIWIRDKSEETIEYKDDKGNWFMKCTVSGYAREIKTVRNQLMVKTLDGPDPIHDETYSFNHGNSGYLYFKCAANGYLIIFFDDMNSIQRCVPYNKSREHQIRIDANREYIFFSGGMKDYTTNKDTVDMVEFYTNNDFEYNQFYVVFSPDPLGSYLLNDPVPLNNERSTFKSMPRDEFHQWLQKNRIHNKNLQVSIIGITIEK